MNELNSEYKSQFDIAVQRTKKSGYSVPLETHLLRNSSQMHVDTVSEKVFSIFKKKYAKTNGNFNLKEIKGQCLKIHSEMQKFIIEELNIPTILTIGYLNFNGQEMFKFETLGKHNINKVNEDGKKELGIHVWLTLQSYEIIDFTFMAQLAYVNYPQERKILLEDAPTFIYNFGDAKTIFDLEACLYHPMFVGKDILSQNGFVQIR